MHKPTDKTNKLRDFTKIKFDIIITAGQSNCEGSGIGDVEAPFKPRDNLWFMNKNFTISQATEKANGNLLSGAFKLTFANNYIDDGKLAEDRELIIIDSAVGATGFRQGMWGENQPLTMDMINMTKTILSLNPKNKIIAFLWHQGENSICFDLAEEFHKAELRILLNEVIDNFGKDFPFIAGDFVPSWKLKIGKKSTVIANAIDDVFCNEYIHFSRKSSYELGERYYQHYINLM